MTRPLRLQFPDALYHVFTRGNARQNIFGSDEDRETYLDLLGECATRCDWVVSSYALMSNHVHHVIQVRSETLSQGMQWLNSQYADHFNSRYDRVGHVYQGRFKSILVQREGYFRELLRYLALNPVHAGIVRRPEDYEWSSHRALLGEVSAPDWLAVDDALAEFAPNREIARAHYRAFVDAGIGIEDTLWSKIAGGTYLGSESWFEQLQQRIDLKPRSSEHPLRQRIIHQTTMNEVVAAVAETMAVDEERVRCGSGWPRSVAAWVAWNEALLPLREIASTMRLQSAGYVSRLIRDCDRRSELRPAIDHAVSTLRRKKETSKT